MAGKYFGSLFSSTYIFGGGNSRAGAENLAASPTALYKETKINGETIG
jgi:dTDP-4-dehydrorhamnose reductase